MMCWWYGVCDCEEVDDVDTESGDRCCVEVMEGAQKEQQRKPVAFLWGCVVWLRSIRAISTKNNKECQYCFY
jgi:hypothetical protein